MLFTKIFGLTLAMAILATSILIAVMGKRFQDVEKSAYNNEKRPLWFILSAAAFGILYLVTLTSFILSPDKTWAAWVIVIVIPVGAALKGSLIIFNKKGREKVTSIEGDGAWRKIALARLVLLPIFLVLVYFV